MECFFPHGFHSILLYCIYFHKLAFKFCQDYIDGGLMHCCDSDIYLLIKAIERRLSWIPISCFFLLMATELCGKFRTECSMSVSISVLSVLLRSLLLAWQWRNWRPTEQTRSRLFCHEKNVRGWVICLLFGEWLTTELKESFRLHVHLTSNQMCPQDTQVCALKACTIVQGWTNKMIHINCLITVYNRIICQ